MEASRGTATVSFALIDAVWGWGMVEGAGGAAS